ncbi:MAG: 1,4-alpha-glucan branching protein GlgB [Myxococcales bacterium]|nr:1,4-alpha-glucan branching protein GlgB [Myxococcales bacterium]
MNENLERLQQGREHNPHGFLGAHPDGKKGVTIRVYRPDALTVRVLSPKGPLGELDRVEGALFAGTFPAKSLPQHDHGFSYELEVTYPDNVTFRTHDPYAFLPTIGEIDLHLFGEGTHLRIQEVLGAHRRTIGGVTGTSFAVWAPNAKSVRTVGSFNQWDGRLHPMRSMGSSGIWEIFIPGVEAGALYKFELLGADDRLFLKTDPFARACEVPPNNACIVTESSYEFKDSAWMERRAAHNPWKSPMSIYELHLGSWRRTEHNEPLSYRDLAPLLVEYCRHMGFTHVELLPVAEHPFTGSWGYQVTNYFAATSRYGSPDDFRFFVDTLHQADIGVIVDWVPAHFPKDAWALGRYDGSALFEHADPRKGEHPDWGTYIFNFGRNEVRNFLVSNALHWLESFHIDGLRVDAVASMLYLDYSREGDAWVPNEHGGRENLEAMEFLRVLNREVHRAYPGALMIAEESTAWPGVSRPLETGGLGFGFKWNMGWMHDTLEYFKKDPIYRSHHQNDLTFSLLYAFTENFILSISHDEVVHGKGSLVHKMPGDRWQQLANLRAFYGMMWAHPGKQLLFMGSEFAQGQEWNFEQSLDWHLLQYEEHQGIQRLVHDLNHVYKGTPALWQRDFTEDGFRWVDASDAAHNIVSFVRYGDDGAPLLCVCNLAPAPHTGYRIGAPEPGTYREIINTDAAVYGGSNTGNAGTVQTEPVPAHGFEQSLALTLPPLAVLWLQR